MFGLSDYGREMLMREFFTDHGVRPFSMAATLYRDSSHPSDTDGEQPPTASPLRSLTTMPTGVSYSVEEVTFLGSWQPKQTSEGFEVTVPGLEFDVSDSEEIVNAVAFEMMFDSMLDEFPMDFPYLFGTMQLRYPRDLTTENESFAPSHARFLMKS